MSNKYNNRRFIELKYRVGWFIGTLISFLLFFSGIISIYVYLRRKYLKQHIAVVLTYHRVSDDLNNPHITVSTCNFERQVSYLINNFKVISIDELLNCQRKKIQLDSDVVAVTFDDGYKDNYTYAYPILMKHNAPAAVFVSGSFIDSSHGLSMEDIKVMHNNNITFGAHTVTHKVLASLDRQTAVHEINESKALLEEILHEGIKYFAYPYGKNGRDFTDESMQIVRDAGFTAAFATDNGFIDNSSDFFALKRIGVRNIPLYVFKGRISGIFENKFIHLLRRLVGI